MRPVKSRRLRGRIRWIAEAYGSWIPTCPPCGEYIEDCACVCAYCGEREACLCCIGYEVATGGG